MFRHKLLLAFGIILIMFSACNNVPDQAKYIPKDAVAVAGINTQELSKKIAWGMLTGSDLFDEINKNEKDSGAINGLSDAGIDLLSTIYVYAKADERFDAGANLVALIPLSDVKKWEAYLAKNFPEATIKEVNKRKETSIGNGVYIGWNDKMLIGTNNIHRDVKYEMDMQADEDGQDSVAISVNAKANADTDDMVQLTAEMEKAFNVSKDNALISDKRFKKLESETHDVSFWLNYDALMTRIGKGAGAFTGGFALSNTLWKDAALAASLNFEKGKMVGDMIYYTPDGLSEVYKAFSGVHTDKEMLDMLPTQNLGVMAGFHMAPQAVKGMLEKTGVLGFITMGLADSGLTTDDIFGAFTGDMVFSLNNFSVKQESTANVAQDSTGINHNSSSATYDLLYAMKINDKSKFDKLMNLAVSAEFIKPAGSNNYILSLGDTVFLQTTDKYLVISNKQEWAQNYLAGTFKNQERPKLVKDFVYGHTFGTYADIQNLMNATEVKTQGSTDSLLASELKKLMGNATFYGGDFKNNAFTYHSELNFQNKEENSLIILLNFFKQMKSLTENKAENASQTPVAMGIDSADKSY